MADEPGGASRRFRSLLVGLVVVTVLGFTFFLNYRDPWPPLVPRPLEPESEAPREPPSGNLNLTTLADAEVVQVGTEPADAASADAVAVTSLPLRLLATAVQNDDPSRSFARIEDAQLSGARLMVQGQAFEGRPNVTLVTIEPSSVLLENYGTLERLPLDPEGRRLSGTLPLDPEAEPAFELTDELRERRRALGERLRELTDVGAREPVVESGGLLDEADLRPLYEEGELVGVRMDAIRPESLFAKAGMKSGDVVRSVNGVTLGAPDAAADLLEELVAGRPLAIMVERADGTQGVIALPTDEILRRAAEADTAEELDGGGL